MTRQRRWSQREPAASARGALRKAIAALVIGLILTPASGHAQLTGSPGSLDPVYWRQRQFLIPYQANAQNPVGGSVARVRLASARDGGQNWTTLQEAAPNVRGFTYSAPADGEYAFAVILTDSQGHDWPSGTPQAQLRVIVDTQLPTLRMTASRDFSGQVVVRYEANDANLRPETLRIEAQGDGSSSERLPLGPPDVSYPDRLLGQLTWKPPLNANNVRLRATIEDRAGNLASTMAETARGGQMPSHGAGPPSGPAAAGLGPNAIAGTSAAAQPVNWPSNNSVIAPADPSKTAPPVQNPYSDSNVPSSVAVTPDRTPAHFAADHGNSPAAPSLLTADAAPSPSISSGDWQAAPLDAQVGESANIQWINSLTVDVDYDLQSAGPWGVAKVELWATPDGGQTWSSLGLDSDNRSPFRATMPGAGVYGVRIMVEGVNGSPSVRPQASDQPEMILGVDIQAPRAEISGARMGQGEFSDHLVISWSASDEQLGPRPITLLSSEDAEGPWSTIAADLANTGEYRWRLTRQPPQKIFLRLEVRDLAGNVSTYQTPSPLVLILPQPTGRLRSVRPVTTEPGRYRTANGRP